MLTQTQVAREVTTVTKMVFQALGISFAPTHANMGLLWGDSSLLGPQPFLCLHGARTWKGVPESVSSPLSGKRHRPHRRLDARGPFQPEGLMSGSPPHGAHCGLSWDARREA